MNIDTSRVNKVHYYPLLGSQVLTNANNERVCHDIVAKIDGSQEMYDRFVSEAGHRREIIARVSYLCGGYVEKGQGHFERCWNGWRVIHSICVLEMRKVKESSK